MLNLTQVHLKKRGVLAQLGLITHHCRANMWEMRHYFVAFFAPMLTAYRFCGCKPLLTPFPGRLVVSVGGLRLGMAIGTCNIETYGGQSLW